MSSATRHTVTYYSLRCLGKQERRHHRHHVVIPFWSFTHAHPTINQRQAGQDAAGDRDSITTGDSRWSAAAARGG